MNKNYCFRCAQLIEVPPKDDPIWETIGDGGSYYNPAYVIEVVEPDEACKCTVVCWECFNEIAPDMWLDKASWDMYNPAITYEVLPHFDRDASDREGYTEYIFTKENIVK